MNKADKIDFQVLFPDEREKGETPLRQCQLVMLRMLKIFDFLCQKYDIKYFLTGGSLLGAVRHQGFIPWDDDLDVGMTRENYEKFMKYAVPELPYDIFFQHPDTDSFYPRNPNVDARLRDKYSSYKAPNPLLKYHLGFQIDIFVYDRAFLPSKLFIVIQNRLLEFLNNHRKRTNILKFISKWMPFPFFIYASNFVKSRGENGTYVTRAEYETLVRRKFEDIEALIPLNYDSYLRRQYGDYMQLPPVEKRESHHQFKIFPFTPCKHQQVLYWQDRSEVSKEAV